jgi:hypothetical protein
MSEEECENLEADEADSPQKLALDWITEADRQGALAQLTSDGNPDNIYQLLQAWSLVVVYYTMGLPDHLLDKITGLDPCGKDSDDIYTYPGVDCDENEKKVIGLNLGKSTWLNGLIVLIIHNATLDKKHC